MPPQPCRAPWRRCPTSNASPPASRSCRRGRATWPACVPACSNCRCCCRNWRASEPDAGSTLLQSLRQILATPPACLDLLQRAIAAEPAAMVRDGGVMAPGFDAELDELRGLSENAGQFLLDLEARERARTGIANLRVEYNKVHGFYIEVTHGQSAKVPDDYRRRQTLKNAERYITPELKVFEDKALSAQERALMREKILYEQLLARPGAAHRRPAARGAGGGPARHPGGAGRTCQAARLVRAAAGGRAAAEDRAGPPPGGGKPDRALHRQRLRIQSRAPAAADHRPQHGRQIDLHAADRADHAAGLRRQLRAGRRLPRSARSTASSPASAPPTTWPAAARPSWWK